ncbi:hypothetical protein DRP04_05610 [Archaeoglobales archaeon]|nr:MAG: hypothetical protein DRP04_05610 [Archaeoglobales archaeon]
MEKDWLDKIDKIVSIFTGISLIFGVCYGIWYSSVIGADLRIQELRVDYSVKPPIISFYLYNVGERTAIIKYLPDGRPFIRIIDLETNKDVPLSKFQYKGPMVLKSGDVVECKIEFLEKLTTNQEKTYRLEINYERNKIWPWPGILVPNTGTATKEFSINWN